MKELGEYLKENRTANSVELEEAAEDLVISKDELENIEEGNIRAFKDVLELKEKVKAYAKYLGLNPDKIADEFNDFMFEHTSKISLADIKEAEKSSKIDNTKKMHSPYTKVYKKKLDSQKVCIALICFLTTLLLILVLIGLLQPKTDHISEELEGGSKNEFAYKVNSF